MGGRRARRRLPFAEGITFSRGWAGRGLSRGRTSSERPDENRVLRSQPWTSRPASSPVSLGRAPSFRPIEMAFDFMPTGVRPRISAMAFTFLRSAASCRRRSRSSLVQGWPFRFAAKGASDSARFDHRTGSFPSLFPDSGRTGRSARACTGGAPSPRWADRPGASSFGSRWASTRAGMR